jgi:hypothetical protein
MRLALLASMLVASACASGGPRYDEDTFERVSSANPIDRGTEMLRQIRHAEIERDKQRAGETKKTPRLFRSQENDAGDSGT